MPKRKILQKTPLKTPAEAVAGPTITVQGRKRDDIVTLSREALERMDRYERSGQRAVQRLGTVRLG